MKLKQGQKYKTKILEGAGEYKEGTYDSKLIDFNVSKNGEVIIKAKKTGKTYAQIIDKYNQTQNLKVKIKDTRLVVGNSKLNLKTGEKYLVPIYDHYGTIQIQKTNSNVFVRYKSGDNGTDYLDITAKKSGRSIIGLRDEEGNRGSIVVEVNGGGEEESEEKEEGEDKEEKLFEELLKKIGISEITINSVENGVKINSIEYSQICELKREGKYFTRPQYGKCVDNSYLRKAWECEDLYTDLYTYGKINSCIKTKDLEKYQKYQNTFEKLNKLLPKLKKDRLEKIIYKINELSEERQKSFIMIILKDIIQNEINSRKSLKDKDLYDLNQFGKELKIIANNGYDCNFKLQNNTKNKYDGCKLIPSLSGKSRVEIEKYALNYSKKLFNYKLNYDSEFRNNYNLEVDRQLKKGINKEKVIAGLKEGPIIATKDYLMGYKEKLDSLENLSYDSISSGLDSLWGTITHPQQTLNKVKNRIGSELESIKELGEIVINIDEIVIPESDYKKGYDTGYAATSAGLEAIPVGKLSILLGGSKISESLKDLKKLNKDRKDRDKKKEEDKKAKNLEEQLALQEAKTNLNKGVKIMDRSILGDTRLGGLYDKYRYVHRSKNGNNITVHYYKHYLTGEVKDFKIKRNKIGK